MLDFALRFIGAGMLVAVLPAIARGFGDRVAGIILVFPVVTFCGFLVLGLERGVAPIAQASAGSIIALPAVLTFLFVVHVGAKQQRSLAWILIAGLIAWLLTATIAATVGAKARIQ